MTAFWLISPMMCIIIRFYLQRENKRRERLLTETDTDSEKDEVIDAGGQIVHIGDRDLDKTDRENLKFMYPL
jgi:ACS family allantoate permease-like MFS transporter